MKIDHWLSELPEFDATLQIVQLLEEQKKARVEAVALVKRANEIDSEVMILAKKHWKDEEIFEAKKSFDFNKR